jgi:hypothetical protein
MVPQVAPAAAHVVGVQHWWLTVQLCPVGHWPQATTPPQPSDSVPQFSPAGHVVRGTQPVPHWLDVPPPPHVSGALHVPQFRVPQQPSGMTPQVAPEAAQVVQ